ncbi:hypothetical protein J7K43_01285 [Candidatus Calescamantes bacterium]|nr:hypothetical protein [Candidatus Calescamantes bacterium]
MKRMIWLFFLIFLVFWMTNCGKFPSGPGPDNPPDTLEIDTLSGPEYPLLAAFWQNPTFADISTARQFSLIILDMENVRNNPSAVAEIKNSGTTVLAYSNPMEVFYPDMPSGRVLQQMILDYLSYSSVWWLRDVNGQSVEYWAGMRMLNLSTHCPVYGEKRYLEWIADFLNDSVYRTGLVDGYLIDNCWRDISWLNRYLGIQMDTDANGVADNSDQLDNWWRLGIQTMLQRIRQRDPSMIIVGNQGDSTYYLSVLDGKMWENFPNDYLGGWLGSMKHCLAVARQGKEYNIIHAPTSLDEQIVRFVFCSALVCGAYFCADYNNRSLIWWPEYYDVNLGRLKGDVAEISHLFFGRNFEFGCVLVNGGDSPQTIEINNVGTVIVPAQDGVILQGGEISN